MALTDSTTPDAVFFTLLHTAQTYRVAVKELNYHRRDTWCIIHIPSEVACSEFTDSTWRICRLSKSTWSKGPWEIEKLARLTKSEGRPSKPFWQASAALVLVSFILRAG